jgi:hypothetical protein
MRLAPNLSWQDQRNIGVHGSYLELKIRRIIWRIVLSGVPVSGRHLSGEKALLRLVIKS